MTYLDDCREQFAHGYRVTANEYKALRKAGYGEQFIAKLAAADAEEYERQIDSCDTTDGEEYQCFLRGCLNVARQESKRLAA